MMLHGYIGVLKNSRNPTLARVTAISGAKAWISLRCLDAAPTPDGVVADDQRDRDDAGAAADVTDSARGTHIRHLVAPHVETTGYFVAKTEMPPFGKPGIPAWNGTLTRCVVLSIATEWAPLPAATV
jgi:hypothetical protein